jgi:hypothetical protein
LQRCAVYGESYKKVLIIFLESYDESVYEKYQIKNSYKAGIDSAGL